MPKNSKERAKAWKLLANKGDYTHNKDVIIEKSGVILTKYRMGKRKENVNVDEYLPCEHCLGLYQRKILWKHQKTCVGPSKTGGRSCQAHGRMLLSGESTRFSEITSSMKDDSVTCIVKSDRLIRRYGQQLTEKHGDKSHLKSMISASCCELARLVEVTQQEEGISSLEDSICPQAFDKLKKCVRILTGYDENQNVYKNPSLAMKLGGSIKKCAFYVIFYIIVQTMQDWQS